MIYAFTAREWLKRSAKNIPWRANQMMKISDRPKAMPPTRSSTEFGAFRPAVAAVLPASGWSQRNEMFCDGLLVSVFVVPFPQRCQDRTITIPPRSIRSNDTLRISKILASPGKIGCLRNAPVQVPRKQLAASLSPDPRPLVPDPFYFGVGSKTIAFSANEASPSTPFIRYFTRSFFCTLGAGSPPNTAL